MKGREDGVVCLARIGRSAIVKASPEKVFALLAEIERSPEFNVLLREVEITSQVRTGVGVTFHLFTAEGFELDFETTEWVENEKIGFRSIPGSMTMLESPTLKPVPGGTEVTKLYEYDLPYSFIGEIIDRLRVQKRMEEGLEKTLQNLKELFEKEESALV